MMPSVLQSWQEHSWKTFLWKKVIIFCSNLHLLVTKMGPPALSARLKLLIMVLHNLKKCKAWSNHMAFQNKCIHLINKWLCNNSFPSCQFSYQLLWVRSTSWFSSWHQLGHHISTCLWSLADVNHLQLATSSQLQYFYCFNLSIVIYFHEEDTAHWLING